METKTSVRPELAALPLRMLDLPIDERGYPVPWFVDWIDGKPEFRAMDPSKFNRAIRDRLCWVCGGKLGIYLTFVAGPMCGINRTSSEPPCHHECAAWSAKNCPFLVNPGQVRRPIESHNLSESAAGFGLSRNPGVAMLWTTRVYDIFKTGSDGGQKGTGYLIQMGEPDTVEWFREGRIATRAEVVESIESGYPALMAMAASQEGAVTHLTKQRQRFEKWLPA